MLPHATNIKPTPASQLADPQQPACADAELMRQADERRRNYFGEVRRNIVLAAGELP